MLRFSVPFTIAGKRKAAESTAQPPTSVCGDCNLRIDVQFPVYLPTDQNTQLENTNEPRCQWDQLMWPCSFALCAVLSSRQDIILSKCTVLEIGAGLALPSLFLYHAAHACKALLCEPQCCTSCEDLDHPDLNVVVTDGKWSLSTKQAIRGSICKCNQQDTSDSDRSHDRAASLQMIEYDWCQPLGEVVEASRLSQEHTPALKLVLASDVLYEKADWDDVFSSIAGLLLFGSREQECICLMSVQVRSCNSACLLSRYALKYGLRMHTLDQEAWLQKIELMQINHEGAAFNSQYRDVAVIELKLGETE